MWVQMWSDSFSRHFVLSAALSKLLAKVWPFGKLFPCEAEALEAG